MKKLTKVIAVVLAVAMVACFAACGAKDNKDDPTNNATPTNAANPTAEATGTFKFGLVGPLTGDAAIYGNAAKNGAQIAVDEINAKDGAVKIEFNAQDDAADPETSINAYNELRDWGMQVLVGPVTTGAAISVAAQAYNDRVFCITPSASSTDVIDGNDNMFQVCFTDPNQGVASADYIATNFTGKKVAVIYRNDDAYSQGIRDTFVKEAEAKNVEVVYEGTFTSATSTDFSVQVSASKNAGADVVFLPIYYQPASVILKQASDVDYAPVFFGVDGLDGILTMPGFDAKLAEGVMLLTPFSADAESAKDFVEAYTEKFGETPNQFAADGYDAVYAAYAAIVKAGCNAEDAAEDLCDALIGAIKDMSFDGLTGKAMTWDATGAVSKAPMAVVIKDGVYVTP